MDLTKENIVVLSHTVPIVRELPHCSGLMLFVSVRAALSCGVCSSVIFVVYSLHIYMGVYDGLQLQDMVSTLHTFPVEGVIFITMPQGGEYSAVLCSLFSSFSL